MPARPLVGLSTSQPPRSALSGPLGGADRRYPELVEAAGGLPVLLPILPELAEDYAARIDALLLIGGVDAHPRHFGEHPRQGLGEVDEQRDSCEQALYRSVRQQGRPVFGICRDVQLINVLEGGTLYQHLPDEPGFWADHAQVTGAPALGHEVSFTPGSRLAQMRGERAPVNSYHHQAIKTLAPSLRAAATAPDGLIEAVEGQGLIGVQWRPELLFPRHPQGLRAMQAFMGLLP